MIKLKYVFKHYGTDDQVIRAVEGVSLDIEPGEFVVITGPSGSGKTTLLNLAGGMTRPMSGKISVAGKDILSMTDAEISRFRATTIGFAFQFQSMLPSLSAIENVMLPLLFSDTRGGEKKAAALLDAVGLADRTGAFSHELSAGQQRRVCIARALINDPMALLCDEPTGDLDPETESSIMNMIAQANQKGATVLMTTHNAQLRSFASRSLEIRDGQINSPGEAD